MSTNLGHVARRAHLQFNSTGNAGLQGLGVLERDGDTCLRHIHATDKVTSQSS